MSFSIILKRALTNACYGFCGLTLLYSLVMIGKYDTEANMSVFTVLLFYPLCLSIALANGILHGKKMSGFLCALIRYIVFLVSVWLFICLPHRATITGTVALILFFVFTLFYVIGSLIFTLCFSSKRKNDGTNAQYVNVYKNEKEK